MRKIVVLVGSLALLVFAVVATPVAAADEPEAGAPKSGFADGKYVDAYFGVVYQLDGLEEGFGFGGDKMLSLWAGKAPGDVDIEILVTEQPHPLTAIELRDQFQASWSKDDSPREQVEKGDTPEPWILYVQESLAGFHRHHGYGFYTRGDIGFVVHAQVREKSDTSGAAIQKALAALTVGPAEHVSVLAYQVARSQGKAPTDPTVLLTAAGAYLQDRFLKPERALELATLAKQEAKDDTFDEDQEFGLEQTIGLAQLRLGKREESIPTWKRCIELAPKTEQAKQNAMYSWYNLACAYSLLGKLDEAFDALGKAYASGAPEKDTADLRKASESDPDLENMRKDPRWK